MSFLRAILSLFTEWCAIITGFGIVVNLDGNATTIILSDFGVR